MQKQEIVVYAGNENAQEEKLLHERGGEIMKFVSTKDVILARQIQLTKKPTQNTKNEKGCKQAKRKKTDKQKV